MSLFSRLRAVVSGDDYVEGDELEGDELEGYFNDEKSFSDILYESNVVDMPPRTRFNVTINERLAKDFDELASAEGVSRAEIFKRALALYKTLKQEEALGARIIIRVEGQIDRQLIAI